jgi:formimidoylglutamate deiminase
LSGFETGWLADLVYTNGAFESGVAMFADADGRITRFSSEADDIAQARRLPGRAMLPGLVNVHSHSFQRVIRGRTEHRTLAQRDTFWTWREAMYFASGLLSPDDVYQAARMAFLEMALAGITTVGEFHYLHHGPGGVPYENRNLLALEIVRAAEEVGLRIALLRTAYVRAGWRKPPDPGQARFLTPRVEDFIADTESLRAVFNSDRAWVGVAPHSVRAVPLPYLRETIDYARAAKLPLHMHASEQPAEVEACLGEYNRRPVELLEENGALDARFSGIHSIHLAENEIGYLGRAQAMIGACPTTERNLGDGVAPADQLLQAGAGICFGSDSNVQIDVLEDARSLEYHLRLKKLERAVLALDLAKTLFTSATETGARSLAAPGGALEVGKVADFFTVDLDDPSIAGAGAASLLNHVVFGLNRMAIRDVCIGGRMIVEAGRHPLQEDIVRDFAGLQRRIWGPEQ